MASLRELFPMCSKLSGQPAPKHPSADDLVKAMKDASPNQTLAMLHEQGAILAQKPAHIETYKKVLLHACDHKDPRVRAYAISALGTETVKLALFKKHFWYPGFAGFGPLTVSLSASYVPIIQQALRMALTDEDPGVIRCAAQTAAYYGSVSIRALRDKVELGLIAAASRPGPAKKMVEECARKMMQRSGPADALSAGP